MWRGGGVFLFFFLSLSLVTEIFFVGLKFEMPQKKSARWGGACSGEEGGNQKTKTKTSGKHRQMKLVIGVNSEYWTRCWYGMFDINTVVHFRIWSNTSGWCSRWAAVDNARCRPMIMRPNRELIEVRVTEGGSNRPTHFDSGDSSNMVAKLEAAVARTFFYMNIYYFFALFYFPSQPRRKPPLSSSPIPPPPLSSPPPQPKPWPPDHAEESNTYWVHQTAASRHLHVHHPEWAVPNVHGRLCGCSGTSFRCTRRRIFELEPGPN